ncbi:hypothetical protein JTZ10_00620 [Gordonia rubripertincta]|uniref:Uncharacterized protein n=1 Tax=Gordonia rubripertincta TaxID=36822 RepID=A0AAW4FYP5_GORRU|nr:hypothetical protein [Gordonia rubripertincta]MBM7276248.1 hypothetical protein [Gordonia rubripertincta]QMU21702.1 hypothetical protein H3V45_04100 [Gordonia rubripertincta]
MITVASAPVVLHLATHPLILALPAVIPAFILVGVIIAIAIHDRRRGDDEDSPDSAGPTDPDHTVPPTRNEADDPDREAD